MAAYLLGAPALMAYSTSDRLNTAPAGARPASGLDTAAVHRRHLGFVCDTIQRLGARGADLEDLTQEVFIVVHRRLGTYDAALPLAAWLHGICRRVMSSHRRRAHRCHEIPGDVPDVGDGRADPERQAQERQDKRRLDVLLDTLDDDKRSVFMMFEVDGMSCDEIASELGIPVGTVHSRLHTARGILKRGLVQGPGFPRALRAGRGR